jgi:tRNA-uridine 2-sulfurtransferase
MTNKSNTKVFVALSGGVDSAVSAYLLLKEGYDVTGVYMKNWSGDDYGIQADCPWEKDQADAEAVCKHLSIPFRSFNFEKEYRNRVVEYFFNEYEKGRTPNPDVMCNKEIKFKLFLEKAIENGADMIATGHYARREVKTGDISSGKLSETSTTYHLLKGLDTNKDQTYFLYNITHDQLSKTLFPIGHLEKPEVRKIALEAKLPNAQKPDSQGICFIGEINVLKFLMSRIPEKTGDIIDIDSKKKVGEHKGVYFYTIGQRDGLRIGGQEVPYFVVDKDINANILYVGHGTNHPSMYKSVIELENLHWISGKELSGIYDQTLTASIRYRHKPQTGRLDIGNMKFIFNDPQRAPSSGQSLVIYAEDECLGGGIIK